MWCPMLSVFHGYISLGLLSVMLFQSPCVFLEKCKTLLFCAFFFFFFLRLAAWAVFAVGDSNMVTLGCCIFW